MRYVRRRKREGRSARRGGRLAGHRAGPGEVIDGGDVLVVGLFSAKRKDFTEVMDAVAGEVERLGGRVVGRFVQRRGVSGGKKGHAPGGRENMDQPYSSRTLVSTGKAREIAAVRAETDLGRSCSSTS